MVKTKEYKPKLINVLIFSLSFFVAVSFWGAMYEEYKYPHWSLMVLHMLTSHGLMGYIFAKEYISYKRNQLLNEWRKNNK